MKRPGFARTTALIAVVLLPLICSRLVFAADPTKPEAVKPAAAQAPAAQVPGEKPKETPLDINQQVLGKRFEQFQNTLLQMAEQMRKSDPDRAELIFRALSKSQEDRVIGQMRTIEKLLSEQKFGDSVNRQEDLAKSLYDLLELLQSENRLNEIDAERKRIEALLKDVNKLIGDEKDVRAATERGTDADRAGNQQKDVSDKTQKTIDKINKQDAQKRAEKDKESKADKTPAGESKPGEPKPGDAEKSEGKKPDGKPDDGKKPEKDKSRIQKIESDPPQDDSKKPEGGEPSDGKPQDGPPQQGKPQQGKPQPGKPQDGQSPPPSDAQKQQQQTPGKKDLEQAREEMQKALDELKKLDRNQASRHQDEALKRLLEAKEKFEEILRQLREEENKLTLTALEARFRKMLSLQLLVYNDTVNLAKTGQRTDEKFPARATQLARKEDEIVQEVAKALLLLREEGSSVAFPEAAEAIREDMVSVSKRLDQADPGELTQTIEQNVIEALEEMIDALQMELEKVKDSDPSKDKQQDEGEKDPEALVDVIAELKMLRSLQLRINRQTKKLGRLIEGEQASEPEVVEQLQTLARRQSKIQQATYDLSTGKNK